MTPASNPYSPPLAPLDFQGYVDDVTLEGSRLAVPDGYVFPPVCPISGAVSGLEHPVTRRVSAHRPWIYLLLLLGLIPYIIGAIIGSQRGTFVCRMSTRVLTRWRWIRIVAGLAFFASFYVFVQAFSRHNAWLFAPGLIMMAGGFCTACGMFEGIKATRVRDGRLWLSGIPKRVRQQIVEIEFRRRDAARKAAAAQLAASAHAATTTPQIPAPLLS